MPSLPIDTSNIVRRKTIDIKIPGAYVDYLPKTRPTQNMSLPQKVEQPRRFIDVKIPGAFMIYPDSDSEMVNGNRVEEHARKIEIESICRSLSHTTLNAKPKPKPPIRHPSGEFESMYLANVLNSRSRYRGRRPVPTRSLTVNETVSVGVNMDGDRPQRDSTQLLRAVEMEITKVKPLRRLSLGDISEGLRRLWDV